MRMRIIPLVMMLCVIELLPQSAGMSDIFNYGASARSLGFGGGGTGLADDIAAITLNPAGLGTLGKQEVMLSYNPLFNDSLYGFSGYAFPTVDFGTFAVGLFTLSTWGIPLTDEYGVSDSSFTFLKFKLLAGYGIPLPFLPSLAAGVNIKVDAVVMGSRSVSSLNADAGLLYASDAFERAADDMKIHWQAGLAVRNILFFTGRKLDSETEYEPIEIRAGGNLYWPIMREVKLQFPVDVSYAVGDTFSFSAGVESILFDYFRIRAGYLYDATISFGAGISIMDIRADYALLLRPLGMSHNMSVSWAFGADRVSARRERDQALTKRISNEVTNALAAKDKEYAETIAGFESQTKKRIDEIRAASAAEAETMRKANADMLASISNSMQELRSNAAAEITAMNRAYEDRMNAIIASNQAMNAAVIESNRTLSAVVSSIQTESEQRITEARSNAMKELEELKKMNEQKVAAINKTYQTRLTTMSASNERALKQYEEKARNAEKDKEALLKEYSSALDLFTKGDMTASLDKLKKLQVLDPRNENIVRYIKIIEADTQDADSYSAEVKDLYREGTKYYIAKDYQKAVDTWNRILAKDPYNKLALKAIERAQKMMSVIEKNK